VLRPPAESVIIRLLSDLVPDPDSHIAICIAGVLFFDQVTNIVYWAVRADRSQRCLASVSVPTISPRVRSTAGMRFAYPLIPGCGIQRTLPLNQSSATLPPQELWSACARWRLPGSGSREDSSGAWLFTIDFYTPLLDIPGNSYGRADIYDHPSTASWSGDCEKAASGFPQIAQRWLL